MPSAVVIIPVRGGSKRLPGKHLRLLAGKSLLERTADCLESAALGAECILSTDDSDVADEGRRLGWTVPFLRPAHLADDATPTIEAVMHALDWYRAERKTAPEVILLIQTTSPLRSPVDIQQTASALLSHPSASAAVTFRLDQTGRHGTWQIDRNGYVVRGVDDTDRPRCEPNGAAYAIRENILRTEKSFFPERTLPVIMPPERSVDIDTIADWNEAEFLLSRVARQRD